MDGALPGIFSNNGQQCLAGSRILVERSVFDQVIGRFTERAERLRVGDPLAEDTELGPLAPAARRDRVLSHVGIAEAEGGLPSAGSRPRASAGPGGRNVTECGARGLVGVLVPQANTTVEPEFRALLPPGWSMLAARLTSDRGTIAERLVEYSARVDATAAQFANAPLTAPAFSCTGASYLIGAGAEAELIARVSRARGVPLVTAARAAAQALRAIGPWLAGDPWQARLSALFPVG